MNALALVTRLADQLALASSVKRVREVSDAIVRGAGGLPEEPDARRAVEAVIAAAERHAAITERVAKLSKRAHGEASELRGRLSEANREDGVVIASPSMIGLYRESLPSIARHDAPVLIRGETGTGKELVADRIHTLSRRVGGPFVDVSCGAIPDTLVESTLFGHERGSFTGATDRRQGVFERANGGTLFLDELGELPLAMQAKLLRVLETKRVDRIGSERSVPVDVRVIGATHRSLEEMVAAGTFRADLFYRLGVLFVEIPPLRDRPEDIEALTTAFVARACIRSGRAPLSITPASLARLRAHPWPGNVRELSNVIERAALASDGSELVLPTELSTAPSVLASRFSAVPPLEVSLQQAIEKALAACDGRIYGPRGAAKLLGLKPTTLQSKMLKLGIRKTPASR